MDMKVNRTPAEAGFIDGFADAAGSLPGGGWLMDRRQQAIEGFAALGLPHRRVEAWHYTDLRVALKEPVEFAAGGDAKPDAGLIDLDGALTPVDRDVAVIVDGVLRPDLSKLDGLGKGIEVLSMTDAIADEVAWVRDTLGRVNPVPDEAVLALNMAYMSGGVAIRASKGAQAKRPLHLAFVSTGTAGGHAVRNLVVVEEGAGLTIVESHAGPEKTSYFVNAASEISIAAEARLDHVRIQREGAHAVHVNSAMIGLEADANYAQFTTSLGASVSRAQSFVIFAGTGAEAIMAGSIMVDGKRHCDNTIVVDHAVPECNSNEMFKSVVDDEAQAVFQGKVIVAPDAQKTDGRQMTQGLLLSERAEFTAKPELEIYADDVQCAHGATSGNLDPDLLFYLRTRGIPEDEAKGLLIAAFIGEAIDEIASEPLREAVRGLADGWLKGRGKRAHG